MIRLRIIKFLGFAEMLDSQKIKLHIKTIFGISLVERNRSLEEVITCI